MKILAILIIILTSFHLYAETIEFSEDELATETVLPVFDKKSVIKHRAVTLKNRFEVGSSVGLNMTEALYNNIFWNLNASYHFTEVHGINVVANMMLPGLSKNGQALKDGKIQKSNLTFDPSRAPSSTYSLFGNYQLVAYYGKISLTKQLVMNLSLYGLAGLGVVSFGDSTSIGMDVGFGQKLYFTKNLALRFDMSVYVYPGPDPTAPKTPNKLLLTGGEKLGSSDFEQTVYSHVFLSFGLVYLL